MKPDPPILAAGPDLLTTLAADRVEIEAAAADAAAGTPRKFSAVAYTGAALRLPNYGVPAVIDLAGMTVPRQDLPVLRQHDPGRIVGHTVSVEVLAQRVKASGLISGAGEAAAEVLATGANGFPWQVSVGAYPDRVEYVEAGKSVKVNGRVFNGPLVVARATTLREISFVPLGADGATSASLAAQLGGGPMTFEQWLAAKNIDAATLSAEARAALQAAFTAEQKPPTPTNPPGPGSVDEVMAARRREDDRQRAIATHLQASLEAGLSPDLAEPIGRMAIEQRWTAEQTEVALLRASRPTPPAFSSARSGELNAKVMEAAFCQSLGLEDVEAHFDEQTLEAAHKKHRGGLGIQELVYHCAVKNGYRGAPGKAHIEAQLKYAFREHDGGDIRASGPSTISVSGILSSAANKQVNDAFNSVEGEYPKVSSKRSVSDFKEMPSYSLTGDLEFEEVAAGGRLKHGTLGEQEYGNKAKQYGKYLVLDRVALRNDDAGAFGQANKKLGRGGRLKLNTVFWTEFLKDYTTWWTAGRGNYDDGTDTAFSAAGLAAAWAIWDAKTDPDGKPLGAMAKILLTPPKFRFDAKKLMTSAQQGANDANGSDNPFAGVLEAVCSTYLANSAMGGGYSADAWYILADPNDIPVIEIVYLDGREIPEVTSFALSEDGLGMGMRALFDFGVRKQEYRGGLRLKGTA